MWEMGHENYLFKKNIWSKIRGLFGHLGPKYFSLMPMTIKNNTL